MTTHLDWLVTQKLLGEKWEFFIITIVGKALLRVISNAETI